MRAKIMRSDSASDTLTSLIDANPYFVTNNDHLDGGKEAGGCQLSDMTSR